MPVDHIQACSRSGPVDATARRLARRVTRSSTSPWAPSSSEPGAAARGRRPAWPRCRCACWWRSGRRPIPHRSGNNPGTCRWRRGSTRPRCWAAALAVVSHGGSGTFLGALAQGVPQLCLPQARRPVPERRGREPAGASLTLRPAEVTAASVRAAVERLLADPDLRVGAERVADEIAAMPGPDEVVVRILVARFDASMRTARQHHLTPPLTTAPVSRSTSTAPAHRCSACPAGRCSTPATSATSAGSTRTGRSLASTCAGPALRTRRPTPRRTAATGRSPTSRRYAATSASSGSTCSPTPRAPTSPTATSSGTRTGSVGCCW